MEKLTTPFRILLIDANTPWMESGGHKGARQVVLPIGLMYLSSAVKAAFSHDVTVELINTAIDCLNEEELDRRIRSFLPDIVGFRALTVAAGFFEKLVMKTHALLPAAVIVAGGPHATMSADDILKRLPVDYVVTGEGERVFVELLKSLASTSGFEHIPGLWYRHGNGIRQTVPSLEIQEVDTIALPDYSIIKQDKYASVLSYAYTLRKQGVVLSSRGCPFHCKYCTKYMGNKYRPRSPVSVVDEIQILSGNYGIRDIMFVDDTFNVQPSRAEAIFKEIKKRGLRANYYFPAGLRPDLMTTELIDLLAEAGTSWITYAVESAVPRIRDIAGRTGDIEKAKNLIDYTISKGVMVGLFFMIGFPTETPEEAMATLQFVRERAATMPYFFSVKYFPGTELTKTALDLGAIDNGILENINVPYHDITKSYTSTLSTEEFKSLYTFYLKDILLDQKRLRNALRIQEKYLSPDEIAATYSALLGREIKDPRKVFKYILE